MSTRFDLVPERNGVVVYLQEYLDCRKCDLYLLPDSGGWILLRTTNAPFTVRNPLTEAHLIVERMAKWFDDRDHYGTMLVAPSLWRPTVPGTAFIRGD